MCVRTCVRACVRVTNRCSSCAAGVVASSVFDIWEKTWNVIGVRGNSLSVPCFADADGVYVLYEFITNPNGTAITSSDIHDVKGIVHPYQQYAYRVRTSTQDGNHTAWVDILHVQLHDAGRYACQQFGTFKWMFFDVVVLGE